jgi:hypothetical protein
MKSTESKIFDFAKEQYKFELDNQDKLNNYITIPIGVISVLVSILSFPFSEPPLSFHKWEFWLFSVLYFLAILSTITVLIFICKHQIGLEYKRIVSPSALKKYHDLFITTNAGNPNADTRVIEDINDILYAGYIGCSETNFEKNKKKIEYYRNIKIFTIVAVLFTLFSYVSYCFVDKKEKINTIEVKNLKELMTCQMNNNHLKIQFDKILLQKSYK